jgi:hypothetical protein
MGANLVVNGNAESRPPGTATTEVTSIPGWTGTANVLPYTIAGYLVTTDPAPPDHGFQCFAAAPKGSTSTLTAAPKARD